MQKLKRIVSAALLTALLLTLLCSAVWAAPEKAATPTELYRLLQENLLALNEDFSIEYTGNPKELHPNNETLFASDLVRAATAILPEQGNSDVAMLNITDADFGWEGSVLHFKIDYLIDRQKLDYVDTKVAEIADSLQLEGADDFGKIKRIYQYMGTSFTYDRTLTKFSDFDGLTTGSMVCQGYALLTYKLMHYVGIPCRVVVGYSQNQPHGWNVVRLNDQWYNLDTTWDSGDNGSSMYWNYFLKSDEEFLGHYRDPWYESAAFRAACPVAKESYDVSTVTITIEDAIYSGLTIRNGKSLQLGTILHPESNTKIHWTSTDPKVAPISDDGFLESLTPGEVIITATAEDGKYIPGTLPVTAVDLNVCSDWAKEELNSYYLRKLYPADLCSDYQTGITREEYAYLLSLVLELMDNGGQYHVPPFEDIKDSSYWYNIIYCAGRGIFRGTSETTFSPKNTLTREQAAKLICSLLDFLHISFDGGESKVFRDVEEIHAWAQTPVDRVTAAGIMEGDGENFNPRGVITREQAGVTLERIYVKYLEPAMEKAA